MECISKLYVSSVCVRIFPPRRLILDDQSSLFLFVAVWMWIFFGDVGFLPFTVYIITSFCVCVFVFMY